jgi:hypothetical protein
MPLPYKTARQGNNVVLREEKLDASGVPRSVVKAHALVTRADTRPETWRRALAKLTNGGKDMQLVLIDLMHGNAYTPKVFDKDGKERIGVSCEPIIPSAEVRRAAAMNLHEMLHGKAVAETEVVASEREAEKKLQLESMSDAQLQLYIDGEYTLLTSGTETPDEGTPSDNERESD